MYWRKVVIPPNKESYSKNCSLLKRNLESKTPMPPVMIAGSCWYVLRACFGSEWKVLRWIFLSIAERWRSKLQDESWDFWQKWIMRRSEKEIVELRLQQSSKRLGVDLKECGGIVDEAEFEELIRRMIREDEDDEQ